MALGIAGPPHAIFQHALWYAPDEGSGEAIRKLPKTGAKGGKEMTAAERLREVREMFHLNQRQLAEKIGVTSQLISQMESGKTPMSAMTARILEAELGVSSVWLTTGSGEMVTEKRNTAKTPPDSQLFWDGRGRYPEEDDERSFNPFIVL